MNAEKLRRIRMHLGLLTARFRGEWNFEKIARWAGENKFSALEIWSNHVQPEDVIADDGISVKKILSDNGLQVSALAHYQCFNRNTTPKEYSEKMKKMFIAAEILGVDVVCTLAGFPEENKSKTQTIREDVARLFNPLGQEAEKRNVKIAFENWFKTNLQHLDHFQQIVEAVDAPNVGFNYDPSHLYMQQIDYIAPVEEFKNRIFHVHAKDTAIKKDRLGRVGILGDGWWRYVIPGYGDIHWGRFILALREIGYDGVLSIEHEDSAFSPEDGFLAGKKFLAQYV